MDYKTVLEKLTELRNRVEAMQKASGGEREEDRAEVQILYGEVEEAYKLLAGIKQVVVPLYGKTAGPTYPTYFEAGYLSGRSIYQPEGHAELLKVIGKARQLAADPQVPSSAPSISNLIQILSRFRECSQYIKSPPMDEREVQDILWIMLRSEYDRVEREETLPRFGAKSYRPDFGIPDLRTLVEVKFVAEKISVASIQEGILADLPAYVSDASAYDAVVVLVYDYAHKLRDPRKFVEDLRSVDGVLDVIVVPGIGG